MSKKLCAILALSLLTAVSSAAALADQCKLIVASRTSLDEAKQLTVEYSERFEVNICEDTCDNDFTYSSSPSERECETVCEAIEDNC